MINIKKLKIPFLIKKSGKIVFINNHKGYEISNITNEMIDFVNQLVAYGNAHPEFKPVLAKYGMVAPPATGAAAPKK